MRKRGSNMRKKGINMTKRGSIMRRSRGSNKRLTKEGYVEDDGEYYEKEKRE